MEGRERVKQFLVGGESDRPPFLPFPTEFAARLAQASAAELLSDPHLLTQSFLEAIAVCDFEAVVLAVPTAALAQPEGPGFPEKEPALAVVREAVTRLRSMLGERVGLVVLLPGPRSLCLRLGKAPGLVELDDAVARLLAAMNSLQPQLLDGFGVVEQEVGEEVGELSQGLEALWNLARYYSLPGLFVAERGTAAAAGIGAHAIVVWEGASPTELARAGAVRVGVPIPAGGPPALPPLPEGGFFTTAGEIPADAEVDWVRRVVAETRFASRNVSSTR